ncbi:hypothetical protein ACR3K2_36180 [Cryptosporidium serpentis]
MSEIHDNGQLNDDQESDEDIKFLICGVDREGGLNDFSMKTSQTVTTGISNDIGSISNISNTSIKNSTIIIEPEQAASDTNPINNLVMVWETSTENRPWSRLLDISPWFNYGFTEKSFKEYIIRQLVIRWERIKKQTIETSDDSLTSTAPSRIQSMANQSPNVNNSSNITCNPVIPISQNIQFPPGMPLPPPPGMPLPPPPGMGGPISNMMLYPQIFPHGNPSSYPFNPLIKQPTDRRIKKRKE